MKHRTVKCQWKLSSSLFLLLSIFLLPVFAKEEPLMFSALLVFSEQAALLLLTKFLLSPQNKKRPIFPEQRHIWTLLKQVQPLNCPTLHWRGIPRAVWACIRIQEAVALTALLGDRIELCSSYQVAQSQVSHSPGALKEHPMGWMQMSWYPGVSGAPILSPLLLLERVAPAAGAVPIAPCPRLRKHSHCWGDAGLCQMSDWEGELQAGITIFMALHKLH